MAAAIRAIAQLLARIASIGGRVARPLARAALRGMIKVAPVATQKGISANSAEMVRKAALASTRPWTQPWGKAAGVPYTVTRHGKGTTFNYLTRSGRSVPVTVTPRRLSADSIYNNTSLRGSSPFSQRIYGVRQLATQRARQMVVKYPPDKVFSQSGLPKRQLVGTINKAPFDDFKSGRTWRPFRGPDGYPPRLVGYDAATGQKLGGFKKSVDMAAYPYAEGMTPSSHVTTRAGNKFYDTFYNLYDEGTLAMKRAGQKPVIANFPFPRYRGHGIGKVFKSVPNKRGLVSHGKIITRDRVVPSNTGAADSMLRTFIPPRPLKASLTKLRKTPWFSRIRNEIGVGGRYIPRRMNYYKNKAYYFGKAVQRTTPYKAARVAWALSEEPMQRGFSKSFQVAAESVVPLTIGAAGIGVNYALNKSISVPFGVSEVPIQEGKPKRVKKRSYKKRVYKKPYKKRVYKRRKYSKY